MKMSAGYYKHEHQDLVDTQYDLSINSCGRYELVHQKAFRTIRPSGRLDFQLLYIVQGEAFFSINGKEEVVPKGNIIFYFPGEEQNYGYYNNTSPVIYWVHFSGFNAVDLLQKHDMMSGRVYNIGINTELISIFDKIITELNSARVNYLEICRLYFKQCIEMSARILTEATGTQFQKNMMLEEAIKYFNENSNLPININEYAKQHNISCCWLIRSFKSYTGTTPAHYIINIRMKKAKSLLMSGSFTMGQIANIIGYDNALYFSRIFKKYVGVSPRNYCEFYADPL